MTTAKASASLTKQQVLALLKPIPDEAKAATLCALVGHSRIQTHCWGYFYCARCEAQLGDSLAGCYDPKDVVLVGHNCETCRANFAACDWKDKRLAPDPFARAKAAKGGAA